MIFSLNILFFKDFDCGTLHHGRWGIISLSKDLIRKEVFCAMKLMIIHQLTTVYFHQYL